MSKLKALKPPNMLPVERLEQKGFVVGFDPTDFKENSPNWQIEILRYLLSLKEQGQNVPEVTINGVIL